MAQRQQNGIVKLALEIGPLATFLVVNFRAEAWGFAALPQFAHVDPDLVPMMASTAAFMVATLASLAVSLALYRRVPVMPLLSGVIVIVFGAATLYFEDQTFIQLKPTIVNLLFAATLFAGLVLRKPLLSIVFDSVLELDDEGWRKLTLRWACFFLFLAALNEAVWRTVDYDTWLYFKIANVPLSIAFTLAQVPLIMRHEIKRPEREAAGEAGARGTDGRAGPEA